MLKCTVVRNKNLNVSIQTKMTSTVYSWKSQENLSSYFGLIDERINRRDLTKNKEIAMIILNIMIKSGR